MKKVSVMLPTYNAEQFVGECLESILSQDYPHTEIVVSDDASSDRTVEVVTQICARYPGKISLNVNHQNIGITRNCNLALSKCDGDYVCLFAGDDVMLPGKIREQVSMLEADAEASLCYHRVEIFNNDDGRILETTEPSRSIFSFFDILEKGGLPGANSVMVRRAHIPFNGYNESIPSVSDWLMFIEISLRGKVLFCNKVLARYRKHASGCSAKADHLIGETLETVDLVSRRFHDTPRVANACRKAKIRYLVGSIARLIASRDATRLTFVNEVYVKEVSRLVFYLVEFYCRMGLIHTSLGVQLFKAGKALIGRRGKN